MDPNLNQSWEEILENVDFLNNFTNFFKNWYGGSAKGGLCNRSLCVKNF